MINHARTLLLNVDSRTYQRETLGEEYIPEYHVVPLPTYLLTARKVLFGGAPDRVFMNFRAHELLSFIHQTELAEFIYALDPRVTYWPKQRNPFFKAKTTITATRTTASNEARLYLNNRLQPDNYRGRAFYSYTIRLINSNATNATVAIADDARAVNTTEVIEWSPVTPPTDPDVIFTGISERISLPLTGLTFQLVNGDINFTTLAFEDLRTATPEDDVIFNSITLERGSFSAAPLVTPDGPVFLAEWAIQLYAKPTSAITSCLPRLDFLGEPFYLELFGVDSGIEPFATFKNIWFGHPSPAYRLAAFTLAVIYRTALLRTSNGA